MNTDPATIADIKSKQISSCPSQYKIALIITGYQEDAKEKATFYNVQCISVDQSGSESVSEQRYRYSQLLEFNEKLIHEYGAIRLLRTFPPKKLVGNKESDFVHIRRDGLQNWMTELVMDEEVCEDPLVREYFHLTPVPAGSA